MNNLIDTFANRLSKAIQFRNIKPIELSEKTGIDKSKLSSYMSGRFKAKQDGVYLLSKEWEEKHPGEKYQEVWNLSIDSVFEEEGNQDKCIYLTDNTAIDDEVSDEVEKLRETVLKMTEKQKRVYELHFIEGYSLTDVATILNVSIPVVYKHKEKILKFIKENFKRG